MVNINELLIRNCVANRKIMVNYYIIPCSYKYFFIPFLHEVALLNNFVAILWYEHDLVHTSSW